MGTIDINVTGNASIFVVRGEVTADDIIAAMERQYVPGAPAHAIWDYSQAILHRLGSGDYERIASAAKERAPHRPGGKTSFVAPKAEMEAVAIKLLEAMSKSINLPIPLAVHQSQEEALAWVSQP